MISFRALLKPTVITVGFLLLMACQQNIDNTQEHSRWDLSSGFLSFDGKVIDWKLSSVEGCEKCIIKSNTNYLPSGPIKSSILSVNGEFLALRASSVKPWITVTRNGEPTKIPLSFDLKNRKIVLISDNQKLVLQENKDTVFEFKETKYKLWIDSIEFHPTSSTMADEKPKAKFTFVLLKG